VKYFLKGRSFSTAGLQTDPAHYGWITCINEAGIATIIGYNTTDVLEWSQWTTVAVAKLKYNVTK